MPPIALIVYPGTSCSISLHSEEDIFWTSKFVGRVALLTHNPPYEWAARYDMPKWTIGLGVPPKTEISRSEVSLNLLSSLVYKSWNDRQIRKRTLQERRR